MKANLDHAVAELNGLSDPLTRCQKTHALITMLDETTRTLAAMRRNDVNELHAQGMPDTAIAAALGDISDRRVGQIRVSKAGVGVERALFAPKAGAIVRILITEKHETERNRAAVMLSTHNMLVKVQAHLAGYELDSTSEAVPAGGDVDLNRSNLIVMMGPRSRPLIRQALSADPAIEWRLDVHDQGYLHDTRTGADYHSDFDNVRPQPLTAPTTCYAHVGRISSPNQRSSFLLIGGLHGPGTAGAAQYLIDNSAALHGLVRRNLWSAIIRVTADPDGTTTGAEIVAGVYKHGKAG